VDDAAAYLAARAGRRVEERRRPGSRREGKTMNMTSDALLVAIGIQWLRNGSYEFGVSPEIQFRGRAFSPDLYGRKVGPLDSGVEEICIACESHESIGKPEALARAKALSRWTMASLGTRSILLLVPEDSIDQNDEQTEPEGLISSEVDGHTEQRRAALDILLSYYDDCIRTKIANA